MKKIKTLMLAVAIAAGGLVGVSVVTDPPASAYVAECTGHYNYSLGRAYSFSGRCTWGSGMFRTRARCTSIYDPYGGYRTVYGGWIYKGNPTVSYPAYSEARCASHESAHNGVVVTNN